MSACFAEQHRGRDQALSVQHCCNSLVVSLSRLVLKKINRCHWSDRKLMSACFAEQHRGRDQALSVQHCCNSLVVSLSRLV